MPDWSDRKVAIVIGLAAIIVGRAKLLKVSVAQMLRRCLVFKFSTD
jgi:ABC-type uncharacterized transport system permease subunit